MEGYVEGLVSVIVPVYNVEKYICECVESVLEQTYQNLEVILIDDSSPDECGHICEQYATCDVRVKVIHKENGGAASARNAGLKVAKGEYLVFVDSDDTIELNALQIMIDKIKFLNADVVECSFRNVYKNCSDNVILCEKIMEYSTTDYLKKYVTDWTCGLAWNKLFKHAVVDGIFYEEGHRIDDEFFTYQCIMKVSKIVTIPDVLYNYRQRQSSVMNEDKVGEQLLSDRLEYLRIRREKVTMRFPEIKHFFDTGYLEAVLYLSKNPSITPKIIRKMKRDIMDYILRKGKIKINIRQLYNLVLLLVSPTNRIISQRNAKVITKLTREYYE